MFHMFHKASFLYIFYVILKRFSFLLDILTFVKEAKVEKNPSKIFIQVGTNDLTVHKDVFFFFLFFKSHTNYSLNSAPTYMPLYLGKDTQRCY